MGQTAGFAAGSWIVRQAARQGVDDRTKNRFLPVGHPMDIK
jgi:hypothetical protein